MPAAARKLHADDVARAQRRGRRVLAGRSVVTPPLVTDSAPPLPSAPRRRARGGGTSKASNAVFRSPASARNSHSRTRPRPPAVPPVAALKPGDQGVAHGSGCG